MSPQSNIISGLEAYTYSGTLAFSSKEKRETYLNPDSTTCSVDILDARISSLGIT